MACAKEEAINPEQLCGAWNEIFRDLNMQVNDLTLPTEAFLVRTLVYYLREFGYIVEPPFNIEANSENTRAKRIFLSTLARQIDHIVQISVKTLFFTYYDLIKPSPKKTSNLLEVLYNYLCYFNMFQKDTVEIAGGQLKKLEKLTVEVEKITRETDRRKKIAKELKAKVEIATKQVNILKPQLSAQLVEKCKLEKLIQNLRNDNEQIVQQLAAAKMEKQHREKLIVTDKEVRNLKQKLEKLEDENNSSQQEIIKLETELKGREAIIITSKELCTVIGQTLEILPSNILTQHKENQKQLIKTVNEYKALELEEKKLKDSIDNQLKELKIFQEKRKIAEREQTEEEKSQQEELKKQKHALNDLKSNLEDLKVNEQELDRQIAEQTCIAHYIDQSARELFETYSHKL